MEDSRHNDEKIMILLTRIDERSLNTLKQLETINGRIGRHDTEIDGLKTYTSEQRGVAKVSGALWGIGSAVFVTTILYLLGIKK